MTFSILQYQIFHSQSSDWLVDNISLGPRTCLKRGCLDTSMSNKNKRRPRWFFELRSGQISYIVKSISKTCFLLQGIDQTNLLYDTDHQRWVYQKKKQLPWLPGHWLSCHCIAVCHKVTKIHYFFTSPLLYSFSN